MEGNVNVKLISMLCYKKLVKMLGKSGNFREKGDLHFSFVDCFM